MYDNKWNNKSDFIFHALLLLNTLVPMWLNFSLACRFGNVFLWDSGSSVGQITGHSKAINAVDYKPTRPFRICTASEDTEVGFFEGPPFKYHHNNKAS